jgi:acyl-CoA thioester hydrolase
MEQRPIHRATVRDEWLDYNGHLNDACYLIIFSQATDALLDLIGMDDAFRRREQVSIFTLETHLCYLREVPGSTTVEVENRVLDLDAKRLHLFQTMRREGEEEAAATAEMMILHVDMTTRRGAPFKSEVHARLVALHAREIGLARPVQAGRTVTMRPSRP